MSENEKRTADFPRGSRITVGGRSGTVVRTISRAGTVRTVHVRYDGDPDTYSVSVARVTDDERSGEDA